MESDNVFVSKCRSVIHTSFCVVDYFFMKVNSLNVYEQSNVTDMFRNKNKEITRETAEVMTTPVIPVRNHSFNLPTKLVISTKHTTPPPLPR